MTLYSVNLNNSVNFKEKNELKTNKVAENIKSDYEKTPNEDSFIKDDEIGLKNDNTSSNNKNHAVKKIIIGVMTIPILLYGGIVLKHKFSKPTFEEIQKYFKQIFEKDLKKEEIDKLLGEYKKLLKNENTEDFARQMIEQLKKDYGIENVATKVNVELLKDGKVKTAVEHTKLGEASPLGEINIMPRTNSDIVARANQKEIFGTGFHELKHMKQFADAYRANPDKFAEALFRRNVKADEIAKTTQDAVKTFKDSILENAKLLKNGDDKLLDELIQQTPELKNVSKKELKNAFKTMKLDEIIKIMKEQYKTEEEMYKTFKIDVEQSCICEYRKILDSRFGNLTTYKEGSAEYKKGMEYIEAYEKYPDYQKDYDAYRKNLLEKEAWDNEDLSKKIYNYLKSIWSI